MIISKTAKSTENVTPVNIEYAKNSMVTIPEESFLKNKENINATANSAIHNTI